MIFCTTKKPEEYNYVYPDDLTLGLWATYGHDPDLFNLLSRVSPSFFLFEQPVRLRADQLPAETSEDVLLLETLECHLDGRLVRDIVRETTPSEFLIRILSGGLEDLPMRGLYKGDSQSIFAAMIARELQWRKNYRGEVARAGKLRLAQFRSILNAAEEHDLEVFESAYLKAVNHV